MSARLAERRDERSGDAQVNGVRLRYWLAGQGPPLVVLHGAGGNLQLVLTPLCGFRALTDQHTLVAYDLRGCGDSEHVPLRGGIPDRSTLAIDRHVEDLAAFVDHLGLARFSLCALSFSGAIATRFALRFPGRVERLLCISGGPLPMAPERVLSRIRDRERYDRRAAELSAHLRDWAEPTVDAFYQHELGRHLCAALASPANHDQMLALGLSGRWKDVPNGNFGFWMQRLSLNYAAEFDAASTAEGLRALRVPALATWGSHDAHPVENMSFLRDALPDCRLVVFAESGHFPQLEETERFTATLRAFLDGAR